LPLSEYYEATYGFKPSVTKQPVPEDVKPAAELKVYPQIPEQTKIPDAKEKGTGIIWLLMWEMITWILWFVLNDIIWAMGFKGEGSDNYINMLNLCSAAASFVAVLMTIIILIRTKRKREKIFLSIYFIVRISLMLLFTYRLLIDCQVL
jgi:hypothetical protein